MPLKTSGEVPTDPVVDCARARNRWAPRRPCRTSRPTSCLRSTGRARARFRSRTKGNPASVSSAHRVARRSCRRIARSHGLARGAVPGHCRPAFVRIDRGNAHSAIGKNLMQLHQRRFDKGPDSAASCSTKPGAGKCWGSSRCEAAMTWQFSSMASDRTLVVPASMAMTTATAAP